MKMSLHMKSYENLMTIFSAMSHRKLLCPFIVLVILMTLSNKVVSHCSDLEHNCITIIMEMEYDYGQVVQFEQPIVQ